MKTKFGLFFPLSRLGKDKHENGPRLLARLLRDEEGSYLLIMTLSMAVFIGLAGLATEGALIFRNHRTVQSAADAAAYSAAIAYTHDPSADITTQAQAIVASYGFVVGTGNDQANVAATVDTTTYSPLTAINVTVTRPQLPLLSSIWVSNPFSVSGSAKAVISGANNPGPPGGCILSLATAGTGIALQGNPSITDPTHTCGIFSNSTASPSISLGGSASITAGAVGSAGQIQVTGSASIGPPPNAYTQNDNVLINPYTGVTTSAPSTATGSCTNTDFTTAGGPLPPGTYCTSKPNKPAISITGGTVTLTAGTYIINGDFNIANGSTVTSGAGTYTFTFNGQFNINGSVGNATTVTLGAGNYTFNNLFSISGATVTLGAGTYIFVGPAGQFTVTSNSTLTGIGVTLMFTDPTGLAYSNITGSPTAMNVQSGATINLQPPTSGANAGMLIIGNSNIPLDTAFNLQANAAGTGIEGVIYLPTADFTWGGGPIIAGGCTQMIAYRVIMSGNAAFDNSNCQLGDTSGGGGGIGSGGGSGTCTSGGLCPPVTLVQ
jgi:Flp pilus assembly protein TadG